MIKISNNKNTNPDKLNTSLGVTYAILSGLCYSLVGYFGISIIKDGLSISNMLVWRFAIASVFILCVVALRYQNFAKEIKDLNIGTRDIFTIIFCGFIYVVSSGLYFLSSHYIGTGTAMVIFFCYPLYIILFNILYYKQRVSRECWISLCLIAIGMVLLSDEDEFYLSIAGIELALVSALLFAIYVIFSKKFSVSPLISTGLVSVGSALSALVWSLVEGSFYVPDLSKSWFSMINIGLICTAIPILLFLKSLNYISSEKASLLSVFEPVFVVIFGVILLGESITTTQSMGIFVILSGSLLIIKSK